MMTGYLNMEKKSLVVFILSLTCVFILVTAFNLGLVSSGHRVSSFLSFIPTYVYQKESNKNFVESKLKDQQVVPGPGRRKVPRFAYLVSGSKGDLEKLWRTLYALYHPWNLYVVHLDLESPAEERLELASRIANNSIFSKVGNVRMITKANLVTYRGPTMVANSLHACAILLKESKDWDWFINLSASDYPLVTQDDLIYTFSSLDRNLNFIEHTSDLGWKEEKRAKPMIVDPGLYSLTKSDIFPVTPRRDLPTAFKLFTGSAWMVLSRSFVEYIIWGWDNLPRTVLMYYTNFVSSPEGYFHTVVCNVPDFTGTVVNHDLHYISWDIPPKQHPHILTRNDTEKMIASGAAFGRKFKHNTPVLDIIDEELLGRKNGSFTPGGWCTGKPKCSEVGDPSKLKLGPGATRLHRLVARVVIAAKLGRNQCKIEFMICACLCAKRT